MFHLYDSSAIVWLTFSRRGVAYADRISPAIFRLIAVLEVPENGSSQLNRRTATSQVRQQPHEQPRKQPVCREVERNRRDALSIANDLA